METSYTPLENPDLSGLDPSTIGVDSSINTQSVNSKVSPFSLDSNNILNISKVANFTSDITVSGIITNTNLENKLNGKANVIDVYNKTDIDNTFATKTALDLKPSKTDVYSKI
jgi:hypothetical protein